MCPEAGGPDSFGGEARRAGHKLLTRTRPVASCRLLPLSRGGEAVSGDRWALHPPEVQARDDQIGRWASSECGLAVTPASRMRARRGERAGAQTDALLMGATSRGRWLGCCAYAVSPLLLCAALLLLPAQGDAPALHLHLVMDRSRSLASRSQRAGLCCDLCRRCSMSSVSQRQQAPISASSWLPGKQAYLATNITSRGASSRCNLECSARLPLRPPATRPRDPRSSAPAPVRSVRRKEGRCAPAAPRLHRSYQSARRERAGATS